MLKSGLVFATEDGAALAGDLYLPEGPGPHPVLVAAPGGGWRRGDKSNLSKWGERLAKEGIAAFAVDYRRSTSGAIWPKNLDDILSAVAFVKREGQTHGLDPARIGLLGASAGAHLTALAALKDAEVKVFVGVYGVYDLMAHWQADLGKNALPQEDPTMRMMGGAPFDDPRAWFEASPLRQATYARSALRVLLIWGDADPDVLPVQSQSFAAALRQARFFVRTLVVPGAGHFWFGEEPIQPGTFTGYIADRLISFVKQNL